MLRLMEGYAWPGNVRQLQNVVRTALIFGAGETLSLGECPQLVAELSGASSSAAARPDAPSLQLQDVERRAILEALKRTERNQAKAARLLGITDRTLREKLRRYRRDGQLAAAGDAP
jgi:DNA-binding NtrC family response regulator